MTAEAGAVGFSIKVSPSTLLLPITMVEPEGDGTQGSSFLGGLSHAIFLCSPMLVASPSCAVHLHSCLRPHPNSCLHGHVALSEDSGSAVIRAWLAHTGRALWSVSPRPGIQLFTPELGSLFKQCAVSSKFYLEAGAVFDALGNDISRNVKISTVD